MIIDGYEFFLELYIDREDGYDIVGRYSTTSEFERAVAETIPKLKEGEQLTGGVGEKPEFPEDELVLECELYDLPSWTINEEYWEKVFSGLNKVWTPFYPEKAVKKVCVKGKKAEGTYFTYGCPKCKAWLGKCNCYEGWSYDRQKADKTTFDKYAAEVSYESEEVSYVCENCFLPLPQCECMSWPEQLVAIDTAILPTIRKLNSKGYFTVYCCSEHPKSMDGKHHCSAHIRWFADYNLELPQGWEKARKEGFIEYRYSSVTVDDFLKEREAVMAELLKWADALPNHSERIKYIKPQG